MEAKKYGEENVRGNTSSTVEEKVNVDYEKNIAFYQVKFIFYAENSDEEKLRALFENEKFIVSRIENGELAEDRISISNLINLD